MKNAIVFLILVIINLTSGISQNLEQNLKKYWYYRDRLKNDFMVVDNNNGQGTNLPAARRYEEEDAQGNIQTYLKWGDSERHLGMYVAVLATEYRLLKDNNHDVSETLQELENALRAFERLSRGKYINL
jgi:hypothetical protein